MYITDENKQIENEASQANEKEKSGSEKSGDSIFKIKELFQTWSEKLEKYKKLIFVILVVIIVILACWNYSLKQQLESSMKASETVEEQNGEVIVPTDVPIEVGTEHGETPHKPNNESVEYNTISSQTNVGDLVFYGTYEQNNNLEDGKEAIQWIVLDNKLFTPGSPVPPETLQVMEVAPMMDARSDMSELLNDKDEGYWPSFFRN